MKYKSYWYFKAPDSFDETNLLISDGMGAICSDTFSLDRKHLYNNIIMIVSEGELFVKQAGKILRISSGEGVLLELTYPHSYYVSKPGTRFVWFHFRGSAVDSYLQNLRESDWLPLVFCGLNLENKVEEMFDLTVEKPNGFELLLSCKIYDIFLTAITPTYLAVKQASFGRSEAFTHQINEYIDENIARQLTLDELAAFCNRSKFHFCHVFKEQFHVSPMQYVINRKIEYAKNALRFSNDAVATVASKVGIEDQGYFCKLFHRIVGVTPTEYRLLKDDSR